MNNAEKEVNKIIYNIMCLNSVFLSGENEALDNQDMANIVDQSKYTNIELTPGLYGLIYYSKNITDNVVKSIPTVGRSLTLKGEDFDTNLTLLHHKRGYIENPNVIEKIGKENLPIHMVSYANHLLQEKERLREVEKHYNNIMENLKEAHKEDTHSYEVDEDTGLVL